MAETVPEHRLISEGGSKGIEVHGWTITTRKAPILNSAELDAASEILPIPLPEMLFGNNTLTLSRPPLKVSFSAVSALKLVNASTPSIQVSHAHHWTEKTEKYSTIKPFDWTYSTEYKGDSEGPEWKEGGEVDYDRLKTREQILFWDEVVLFEDELADNGTALLTLRIRVMPSCFLVLLRFFLRVDQVLFRIHDTRLYHQFGTSKLVREFTNREAPYSDVRAKLPKPKPWEIQRGTSEDLSLLTDSNWVAMQLEQCKQKEIVTREHVDLL
ncbi:TIP41-like family-domain-containing protein [Gaertneriomyces semiglobifer]|nr:TIP41-like family-domain-containing protein [Gaertneriomyces semiglobifer]